MEIKFVDTHCHLEQEEFLDELDTVIKEAQSLGIYCISSAIAPEDWERNMKIAVDNESVFASLGLDPMSAGHINELVSFVKKNCKSIISIGEVGLDYFREREHEKRRIQEESFRIAIGLARDCNLPLQVHSRSAGRAALEVLENADAREVHMHAFDGKSSLARRASHELGYYFSIPTSVVRSPQKQKLVKAIEIEHLLLETDSPVLAPIAGERNVPANITVALAEVARILGRDEEELREIILDNTLRLYSKIR